MDDKHLEQIEARLGNIEQDLKEHMRRTNTLEESMKPVHELMLELRGAIKLAKITAGLVTFLIAILEVYRMWH